MNELIQSRRKTVEESLHLAKEARRDRTSRRRVFQQIRNLNDELLRLRPGVLEMAQQADRLHAESQSVRSMLTDRTYFFGLYSTSKLDRLCESLGSD